MARYHGGRLKIIRRLGTPLPGLTAKTPKREAPIERGGRRRQISDFGRQLLEKQKLRYHYGISETQLRAYFKTAFAQKGVTGEALFDLLERRLDNVIFRLGFAPTMPAARQIVTHRHVMVNGRVVNFPSYSLRVGDTVAIRPASRQIPIIQESMAARGVRRIPPYLEVSEDDPFTGRVVSRPTRDDVPFQVDEALVVAYYTRRG